MWKILPIIFLSLFCMNNENSNQSFKVSDEYAEKRSRMVVKQIKVRGVRDTRVLEAMNKVPRHEFVPQNEQKYAYDDSPLPIGYNQTISQPYIVAYMTEQLQLSGNECVLEVGTGSGYQAAVLCELADFVYSIEIVEPLCDQAEKTMHDLGYVNFLIRCGDGYDGWQEFAPFDKIIITAAPEKIPEPLINQLKPGGQLISPVGKTYQELVLLTKHQDGEISTKKLLPVRFVPMTGKAEEE